VDLEVTVAALRSLYPPIEPRTTGYLPVSNGHEIYYEETGNPVGTPVVFVHGGPGGGGALNPNDLRFFDPSAYRIVLFHQRGCGKSRPHSSLEANTTWHLVEDMERLRAHLGIQRWVVFGGSWGSTLSLAYSERHPDRVRALIIRGIWLVRPHEIRWYYQEGASFLFPDAWEAFVGAIPVDERHDLLAAYHRRVTGEDREERAKAVYAWCAWEASTLKIAPLSPAEVERYSTGEHADALARLECHYYINGAFLDPNQLINDVDRIRHIPAVVVQGRYDVICPASAAWDLHCRWPEAEFHIVENAGHVAHETGTLDRLVTATDRFRNAG
jgi:proline iminopeptidase